MTPTSRMRRILAVLVVLITVGGGAVAASRMYSAAHYEESLLDCWPYEDDTPRPSGLSGGVLPPITFPGENLDVIVELALGADLTADPATWVWTDITQYVRHRARIVISRGRPDGWSQVGPSQAALTLDNSDGRFTRLNPLGAYYGRLSRNTPLRVRVDMHQGAGPQTRFTGYVSKWPPRWDKSGSNQFVPITADGIFRRLGQGDPVRPALDHAILADGPVHYWRIEDPVGTTAPESAVSGGSPMRITTGTIGWRQFDSAPGGSGDGMAAVVNDGRFDFSLSQPAPWTVEFSVFRPDDGSLDGFTIFVIEYLDPSGTLQQIDHPMQEHLSVDHDWYHYKFTGQNVGGNYEVHWWVNGSDQGAYVGHSGAGAIGNLTAIDGGGGPLITDAVSDFSTGYIAIYDHADVDETVHSNALQGFPGEQAHERIERLCNENAVPVAITGTTSITMRTQGADTLLNLLRRAADTDLGVLHETLDGRVGYRTNADRYNQTAAVALDYDSGHITDPWTPQDDDQRIKNDVTVSRPDGSSARAVDDDSIAREGRYRQPWTANAQTDSQLANLANWLLRVGTVDELRYPMVGVDLHRHTDLIPTWLACDISQRLDIANIPSPVPPVTTEQQIQGYTEILGSKDWRIQVTLSPAAPHSQVGVYGPDAEESRYDSDQSTLAADATASDTSLSVVTEAGPLWTTDAAEFPFDVGISGIRITVTAIASAVTDTFTRTVAAGDWGTSTSGHVWTIGDGTAANFSVTGTQGQIAISTLNDEHHAAVPMGSAARQRVRTSLTLGVTPTGAPINWGAVLRRSDSSNLYWIDVQVGTDSSLTLRVISKIAGVNAELATATSATTHSTSVARILLAEIDDDDMIRVKVWAADADEPSSWELTHQASTTDLQTGTSVGVIARLMTGNSNVTPVNLLFDDFEVLNPQTFSVTRSVDGIDKALSAGDQVSLWTPARYGL